jgi:dephospho-CoA kinase
MLIGLTGKYCAGKNYISSLFEARDIPVLDVDKLGYQVLETEKQTIFTKLGLDLQKSDGSLDRRLLGQRVFGNPEKLAILEAIIHPPVNRLTIEWIGDRAGSKQPGSKQPGSKQALPCVINAALLHKSEVFHQLDCIILVKAPAFIRFLRAKHRDKLSWLDIIKRFTSQKDFNSQYLAVNAEIYRVGNPGLPGFQNSLKRRIDKIVEGIL